MPKTLLLADDSKTIQQAVSMTFAGEDVRLITASDGDAALQAAKQSKPDLILADVLMPRLSGYELCQRVRADATLENVRILCISGMVEEDKIQELKLAGADDFIHKPFEVEALIDRMCAQLDLEPAQASA